MDSAAFSSFRFFGTQTSGSAATLTSGMSVNIRTAITQEQTDYTKRPDIAWITILKIHWQLKIGKQCTIF